MPSESELAPIVEELARALQGNVQPETIREELERYIAHGVPLHQAKRDLLTALSRTHGGPLRKKVGDITTTDQAVDLLVRVVSANEREVTARGEQKQIVSGLLGDETGVIPYTAWVPVEFSQGDVLEVSNAWVSTYQGNPQVSINERTGLAASDEEVDVPPPPRRTEKCTVKALKPGMSSVVVKGRILSVRERTVEVQGDPKDLWEGELADATGRVQYTAWHDHGLEEGQVVQIDNAYVRAFRGIASLNFGENSGVKTLDDDVLPPASELEKAKPYTMEELEEAGGAIGVRVDAVVLEVRPGSGLILRCPECRRVLQNRECRIHGRVEGIPDLRIKAVVDDGTGAGTAVFNRPLTEQLLGKDLEQCQAAAKDAMTFDVIQDEITEKVLCRRMRLEANAAHDDYGTTLLVNQFAFDELDDVVAPAEALLERIDAVAQEVAS